MDRVLAAMNRRRDRGIRRQSNLVSFGIGDQTEVNEMVMALVSAFAAVRLCQLDPAALDPVDRSDVNAIGSNDVHVLLDLSGFHVAFSLALVELRIPISRRNPSMRLTNP